MSRSKVLDAMWFSPLNGACIGIVAVETEFDGLCFYIGMGAGVDEATDAQHIARTGARFPYAAGVELMGVEI